MTTMQMAQLSELGQAASTIAFSTLVGSQTYALKRLKPQEHGNRRLRRLFPLLASGASQYHHKHLARIFQVDAESVQILMQHFPATLKTRRISGTDEVLDVLVQSLKGLRYLHDQNMLHLNLKPTNVMFEESGNLRLADPLCYSAGTTISFGINPDYGFFSPSQLDPLVQVSSACDLYGLAMTLALTLNEDAFERHISSCWNEPVDADQQGLVPAPHFVKSKTKFGSRSVARWSKWHSEYQHPNPSFKELDGSLSEGLVAVLDRMLQKDDEARFQSADEVLAAISEIPAASSLALQASSKKIAADVAKNWAKGIETVYLGGPQAGEACFTDGEFNISAIGKNIDESKQLVRLEPDGASWFLDAGSGRFLINGDLKAGRVAVNHGDILRLGAAGPEILVHRNETDPGRILEAAREAMDRDLERVAISSVDSNPASNIVAGRSLPASKSKQSPLLPLLLIVLAAAAIVCIVLFIIAFGGSK